jgi:hypothetical protein
MNLVLNKLYKLHEISQIEIYPYSEVYLPTERIIISPGYYIPKIARIYGTHFIYSGGKVLSEKEHNALVLKKIHFRSVFVAEIWEDIGCDGHINFYLIGYVPFVYPTKDELNWYKKEVSDYLNSSVDDFDWNDVENDDDFNRFIVQGRLYANLTTQGEIAV